MSGYSHYKWQSLGTRESVKETRSNMQQYNKNGRGAYLIAERILDWSFLTHIFVGEKKCAGGEAY